MTPLWTKIKRLLKLWWGWELVVLTPPWVAQRVWPIPNSRWSPSGIRASRFLIRPTDLVTLASPLTTPAIPAESYPRYSRLLSPSIKNLTPFASPTNPTIPHILKIPRFFL